jgi:cysteinyl-tRNA synthetase
MMAMDDDFNTARALAALYDLAREINIYLHGDVGLEAGIIKLAATTYEQLGENVLGLFGRSCQQAGADLVDALMELIITVRQEARQRKDWHTADVIRDRLKALGVIIEDTPHGSRWKRSQG